MVVLMFNALVLVLVGLTPAGATMVVVDNGANPAPIILPAETTHYNRVAANDLADLIEQASGARPEIIEGEPKTIPGRAIWVGYQPAMDSVFPGVDFEFTRPEEILIAVEGNNLAIAGRDHWIEGHTEFITSRTNTPGRQLEYGTVNAVYTFLRDYLNVRWLFPTEIGTDVPEQKTIAFEPFEYRYAPQIRVRSTLFAPWSPNAGRRNVATQEWLRQQRLWLDSLELPGGHAFNQWWDKYHEDHPDYFALQPDGTRSGYPNPHNVKLCSANPAVWDRWLQEAEEAIERDPTKRVFSAASNDGWSAGHCVCELCRDWDHPDAERLTYQWQGLSQDYVALTDREVTFANTLARMLRERYPDRDYYVQVHAYGLSRPAPVGVKPDDNVIISSVANFHLRSPAMRETHMTQLGDWGEVTKNLMWRPNIGSTFGWQWGTPDIGLQQAGEDFRFVADAGGMGLFYDMIWDHWGNIGPHYYLIAQLAWDPYLDVNEVMDDYYHRMYGPAAAIMKEYWEAHEAIRMDSVNNGISQLAIGHVYTDKIIADFDSRLAAAAAVLAGGPEIYRERLAFTEAGWDYTKIIIAIRHAMERYEISGNTDQQAAQEVLDYWEYVQNNLRGTIPEHVVSFMRVFNQPNNRRMSGLHPSMPSNFGSRMRLEASRSEWDKATFADALASGWELVFEDDFDRSQLGDMWQVIEGDWRVENGSLIGSGTIASSVGFPSDHPAGYLRLEFDVTSYVEASALLTADDEEATTAVSDFSSMIHLPTSDLYSGNEWRNSYFFQFGGRLNTTNRIVRHGDTLVEDRTPRLLITPDVKHQIVVENDRGEVRFWVDEQLILAHSEQSSRIGAGYDRIAFYFFTTAKVDNLRVFTKRLADDLDLD